MLDSFPSHGFPHEIQPYRPPQAVKGAHISKVTCCEETVAALSSNGEVFTLAVPAPIDSDNTPFSLKGFTPQPAWSLKKQLSAAKVHSPSMTYAFMLTKTQDVAVGNDGTIIVCTESGHIFVRSRKGGGSGKALKYQVVPYIQRAVEVCANSTGAFGALRHDFAPRPIEICGNSIAQDLASVFPPLGHPHSNVNIPEMPLSSKDDDEDEDELDGHITDDLRRLIRLSQINLSRKSSLSSWYLEGSTQLPYGADMTVSVQSAKLILPVHRAILSARSARLDALLHGGLSIKDDNSKVSLRTKAVTGHPTLEIHHCHPMAVLILLDYLYSDRVLAIWDRRLSLPQYDSSRIKLDLQTLARLCDLPHLIKVLFAATRMVPEPSMVQGMSTFFMASSSPDADVVLQLQDRDVPCHSVILRSRTVFFADFFNEVEWTRKRRDANGIIRINMKHMKWHVMQYVLRFVCCGEDIEMFGVLGMLGAC